MHTITIQHWNKEEFKTGKTEWSTLLNTSDADKLFLSWEWQYSWWDIFSPIYQLELTLLVAYDDNMLIGIAPLYTIHSRTKKIIKTKQLQFIGNICRGEATMPTEFIDFIVTKENDVAIKRAFLQYINDKLTWDEFHFTELKKESSTYPLLTKESIIKGVYARVVGEYKSYYLGTSGKFQDYITQRGKNTRLRMYNRRKVLETKGKVKIEKACTSKIDKHFELLNSLHKKRWGKEIFTGERLTFNSQVAKKMAEINGVNFSVILIDDKPVSIQFNYIINQHEYNIQAGFIENLDKKLALGYLHFGYEIETAFENKTLIYDFLAGEGKNTNYKEHLTDTFHNIVQLQLIKKKSLKILYYINDLLASIKQKLVSN